jgi:hypothetical protein
MRDTLKKPVTALKQAIIEQMCVIKSQRHLLDGKDRLDLHISLGEAVDLLETLIHDLEGM